MAAPQHLQARVATLHLQQRVQTLTVLESELASLKPGARIFHTATASADQLSIAHSHGQLALFPGLSKEGALNDVKRQKQLANADLNQALEQINADRAIAK
ncbi:uncharacterized protein PFL1_00648 [Pseudozyma flocculosa PF-1]|uniref:Uncharacterized protein n=1 Tax=Pseudozyma flocculosa TaxID=84751 RepID=A0A5C3EU74_9BASI|nr:uncharacterized protein PFL1_00648 [Pseudozyma flocculosa PF-1]EPQ32452.1 hypothetical protein PFL1_00648 [Pseudozyma flocculosa PF-1]SPO34561.1 uncharacterized protein PSFLO_00032 [Pseudozyma flocculosa]